MTVAMTETDFVCGSSDFMSLIDHTVLCIGSCWCGADAYCMCTPSLAIDALIEVVSDSDVRIVLIKRRDPPQDVFAITGGFVDVGETVEEATIREVKEETNIDLTYDKIEQFRVYSNPKRDKRRHTVSSVFRCKISAEELASLKRGDDAKSVVAISLRDALKLNLAFDHAEIISDYIKQYHPSYI